LLMSLLGLLVAYRVLFSPTSHSSFHHILAAAADIESPRVAPNSDTANGGNELATKSTWSEFGAKMKRLVPCTY